MDQQPKIPTLKDAQKPQVKIKGLSAGMTLFDRLKQFKKKDLAFILAGLGTLFMAPLAEHFMMAPEGGDGQLEKGWSGGKGGGSNLFSNGGSVSPYETGGGIAQGGAVGGMGDIITPLNVRDPSALVMGPGAAQQPNAGSIAPSSPPPSAPAKPETDYKDALAGAASRAASAAVKKSPLPVPKVALGGSGLRGLGVAGGGTSASGSSLPVGPAAGGTGTGGGGSLNLARSAPGYKGIAGARGPGNPTGLDGTKRAGQNAGDAFSRTGSALSGLNAAASEQIPGAGGGFGGGGQGGAGANDKGPGGSGPGGSKSVGESLAFLEAKERMENRLKNEFEMDKLKDNERLLYEIRNDAAKEIAKGLAGAFTKSLTGALFPAGGASGSTPGFMCKSTGDTFYPASLYNVVDGTLTDKEGKAAASPPATGCYPVTKTGAADAKPKPTVEDGGVTGLDGAQAASLASLKQVCDDLKTMAGQADNKDQALKVYREAAGYASVRDALYKGKSSECTDFPGRLAGADGVTQNIALQQRSLIIDGQIKPFLDTLKGEAKAAARTTDEAKFKVVNDTVEKARTDLSAILKDTGGANLGSIDVVQQKWQTVQDKALQAKNDEIISRLTGISASRTALIKILTDSVATQELLDGKDKDGKDTGDTGKDKIMPQLKAIVVDNSADAGGIPMTLTVNTNKAYPEFLKAKDADIKKADIKPAGGEAVTYTGDPKGIANGTGGKDKGAKSYDQLQLGAKTAIEAAAKQKGVYDTAEAEAKAAETAQAEDAATKRATANKEKATFETNQTDANKALDTAKNAQGAMVTAQTGWITNVSGRVDAARSGVPKGN